ncbi:polysaccharide pyruvyl transferase family protein [Vibrio cyclitrophicus]
MKVAIITFPLINNYGGIIQAYALIKLVKDLGHEPILVNLQPERKFIALGKYFIRRYLQNNRTYPKFVRDRILDKFIVENIYPKTLEIRNSSELHRHFQSDFYDACIVGSDQVFSSMGFTNFKGDFSLGFVPENTIKLSYAASFGGGEFRGDKSAIPHYSNNIKRFNAVSVRESSAIDICKELFGVNAKHVLDPTMMIDRSYYTDLFKKSELYHSKKELFAYVLDTSEFKCKLMNKIADEKSIKLNQVNDGNISGRVISMESWLASIFYSEHVITDSFHGCVFCIIFNKPFHCFVNEERGADRFYSLLGLFGLENRVIRGDLDSIADSEIDWIQVNAKLKLLQQESKVFLDSNLTRK